MEIAKSFLIAMLLLTACSQNAAPLSETANATRPSASVTSPKVPTSTSTATPTPAPIPTSISFENVDLISVIDTEVLAHVSNLVISPDGSLIIAGFNASGGTGTTDDEIIRAWSVADSTLKYELVSDRGVNTAIAISNNGKYIAASFSYGQEIVIWNLETETIVLRIPLPPYGSTDFRGGCWPASPRDCTPHHLEFFPNDEILLDVGDVLELRSTTDGELIYYIEPSTHSDDPNLTEEQKKLAEYIHFTDGDLSRDGNLIAASSGYDNDLWVWTAEDRQLVLHIDQKDGYLFRSNNRVRVEISPDSKLLAGSLDNTLSIWAVESGDLIASFYTETKLERFWDFTFSPDSKFIIAKSFENNYPNHGRTYIWSIEENTLIKTIKNSGMAATALSLAISPNGEYFFLGTRAIGKILFFGVPID